MTWQVEFDGKCDTDHRLEEQLANMGVDALSYLPNKNESDYQLRPGEAPIWKHCRIRLYFSDEQRLDQFLLSVQSGAIEHLTTSQLNVSSIADEHWQTSWKKYWKPTRFGRLIVCSVEDAGKVNQDDTAIYLNPGLAFGTGTHETTALCLEWLSKSDLDGQKVLDYGSGSGILSIAAVARGSTRVIAYDHDPQAVTASRQNSELNGTCRFLQVVDNENKVAKRGKYDLILANIILSSLLELAETFHKLLKDTGTLVVSGILEHQKTVLIAAWGKIFQETGCRKRNEWIILSFQHTGTD